MMSILDWMKPRVPAITVIPLPSYTREHIESLPIIRDPEALYQAMKRDEYLVWRWYPDEVQQFNGEEGCDENARYGY